MTIEVLYFEGCPNYRPTLNRLRSILAQEGLPVEVAEIEVRDEAAAPALKFIGSPTVRINGLDIEMESRAIKDPAFACRRYAGGLPSEDLIRGALKEAQGVVKDE